MKCKQILTHFPFLSFPSVTFFLFIKWKPTVVYWILSLIFLASHYVGSQKPIIQRLAGETLALQDYVWNRLNISWVLFFILMGSANLYVIHHYDTNTWVNFKLFGVLGMTFLFVILQAVYLSRFVKANA